MSADALSPGFMVVHGNRPETLRSLLASWMQAERLAPLEDEVVLVQSNGVAQWLKLQLAEDPSQGGLGIATALRMQLPAQFAWSAYRAVLGAGEVPAQSPFDQSRLVWRLMRLLPELLPQPAFEPLRRFLQSAPEGEPDARKLHQLAQRVADLFDQYQVHRADWLADWARGEDTLRVRGERRPLAETLRWQPALWRALREDVGALAASRSRAEVHARFLRAVSGESAANVDSRLRGHDDPSSSPRRRGSTNADQLALDFAEPTDTRPAALPRRITVFGVSSMPQQVLEVLAALARWCQVLLYVHNPCRHDWSRILPDHELLRAQRRRQPERALPPDAGLPAPTHPLLAAWGRQGRDFIRLLDEHDDREAYAQRFVQAMKQIDCFESAEEAGLSDTVLRRLQDDMLELRPPAESRSHWPALAPDDGSLCFHVAHSPQREVEVLHDRLLAAFAADPTLTPRDVIVMVPDVAAYAPHIQAVFGLVDRQDARHIPYGIADRNPRRHDPLLAALERLLSLPQGRLGASEVLELLDVPALRQRLGLRETELPLLHRWVAQARIRWGLHAGQREGLGLPAGLDQNSWFFGLRRMFLGYAVGDGEPWQDIAPMDEVGGLDAALLGPLSQLLDRLDQHWRALGTAAAPAQWAERLGALLQDFFQADDGSAEALTLVRLQGAVHDWAAECEEAGLVQELPLAIVREHWLERMTRASLSQPFFSGGVTFASLMPMRAIPFRWIGLLGMNDGDYPRTRPPMDFDLMAQDLRPGDRSRREDDRYLLLEALLSAREHLHLSWVGRSIRDNEERPASVLVAQLRDHIAGCWRLAGDERPQAEAGAALLHALTVEHRLQPFHPAYFDGRDPRMASYAREWRVRSGEPASHVDSRLRGNDEGIRRPRESGDPREPAPLGNGDALPPFLRQEPLTLREVSAFARSPVRFFFQQRLRIHFAEDEQALEEHEPFALEGLTRWQLQDELIQAQQAAVEAGEDRAAVLAAEVQALAARGCLPLGGLAEAARAQLVEPMDALFQAWETARTQWHRALPDELLDHAPEGAPQLRLQDWLGSLRADAGGARCRLVIDSNELVTRSGNGRKSGWRLDKLVGHWIAHLAGHLAGQPLTTVVIGKLGHPVFQPLDLEAARGHWQALLALLEEGLCRPLPFALQSACRLFERGLDDPRGWEAARQCYEDHAPRQRRFAELRRDSCLARAFPSFEALRADGRFADIAQTLLGPLRQALRDAPEGAS